MNDIVEAISASGGVTAALVALAIAGLVGVFNVVGSALKAAKDEIGKVITLYFELWSIKIKTKISHAKRKHPGFDEYIRKTLSEEARRKGHQPASDGEEAS